MSIYRLVKCWSDKVTAFCIKYIFIPFRKENLFLFFKTAVSWAHEENCCPSCYLLSADLLSEINHSNKARGELPCRRMNHVSSSYSCVTRRRSNCERSSNLVALRTRREICRSYERYIWKRARRVASIANSWLDKWWNHLSNTDTRCGFSFAITFLRV